MTDRSERMGIEFAKRLLSTPDRVEEMRQRLIRQRLGVVFGAASPPAAK